MLFVYHKNMNLINILGISIGGTIGALLRYAISSGIYDLAGNKFTWGTIVVNLIGSFLIGLFWQFFDSYPISPHVRTMLVTGGIGAFTTFSTYSLETALLLQSGQIKLGIANTVVSAVLGILAVLLGMMTMRYLMPGQQ